MSLRLSMRDFRCVRSAMNINGVDTEQLDVRWNDRRLTARVLDMGGQWDLLEIVGNNLENAGWLNLAMLAACVLDIDGKPLPGPLSKVKIRDTLNKLGPDGVEAVTRALQSVTPPAADEDADKAAVGN